MNLEANLSVDTSRFERGIRQATSALDRLLPKCICWKPTAPGHQIDCPRGRPVKVFFNHELWHERS